MYVCVCLVDDDMVLCLLLFPHHLPPTPPTHASHTHLPHPHSPGLLSALLPYGPSICDHCLLTAGLQPQQHPSATLGGASGGGNDGSGAVAGNDGSGNDASQTNVDLKKSMVKAVLTAVRAFERFLADAEHTPVKGFVLTKPVKGNIPGVFL